MKLTDEDIFDIVMMEESDALNFHDEISRKRATLLDYYFSRPYGDEIEGQSSAVTSDVSDTIEGMLPTLIRQFTQGKNIAIFDSDREDQDEEAKQKTQVANWIFTRQNNGVLVLHNMFKDALLQYTGTVKIYWEEYTDVKTLRLEGLSDIELLKLKSDPTIEIVSEENDQSGYNVAGSYDVVVKTRKDTGKCCVENIPPEEFVIARRARDFKKPPFIGHRSPKTRSELIEMGFDKKIVESLPVDNTWQMSAEKTARYQDLGRQFDSNASNHRPNDEINLGEYYMALDVDGDGIAEYWQVFVAGQQLLSKEQVDDHPFAVCVPIPVPHRAIGTCPAEQVADLQFRKSTLVRQMLTNIYHTNFPRIAVNERVELDDLLTPRAGGIVRVNDAGPIGDAMEPIVIQNMVGDMLQAIEYTNTEREIRTGVTRYNQGLDTDSLNKTATGFKGIQDMSQQRIDLIARIFADTGVREIFEKIISVCGRYQQDSMQIKATGEAITINPMEWVHNLDCRIDVGIGSGDRMEKINNLNFILQTQLDMMGKGLVLADQPKLFKTLDKLVTETGLKEVSHYFNNPDVPKEVLFAHNQQLTQQVQQLQMQVQDPAIAVAKAKAELQANVDNNRATLQAQKNEMESESSMRQFLLQQAQQFDEFRMDMLARLTEMDLKYNPMQNDIPGTLEDANGGQ